jgi:hypothetical protein
MQKVTYQRKNTNKRESTPYEQVVLRVTSALTLKHNVFHSRVYVWFLQHTSIFPLISINRLVFVMDTQCFSVR